MSWLARLGDWWCRRFHRRMSGPLGQVYICWICGRRYQVPWV